MTSPKALLLDLDATLLDNRDGQAAITHTCEVLSKLRPGLDAGSLYRANQAVWQEYFPEIELPWQLGQIDGGTVSLEAWRRTLEACATDDTELAQTACAAYLQLCRENYHLYDDVETLFAATREAGIPLALITNGASDTQRDKLDALGITDRFDAIIISGEVRITKPDPAIFAIALGRLRIGSAEVWHVGDSLSSDIAGARAAGLKGVWLNRDNTAARPGAPRPDLEVATLLELVELLIR